MIYKQPLGNDVLFAKLVYENTQLYFINVYFFLTVYTLKLFYGINHEGANIDIYQCINPSVISKPVFVLTKLNLPLKEK